MRRHEPTAGLRKGAYHHQLTVRLRSARSKTCTKWTIFWMTVIAIAMTPDANKAGACGQQRPHARDTAVRMATDGSCNPPGVAVATPVQGDACAMGMTNRRLQEGLFGHHAQEIHLLVPFEVY